MIYGSVGKLGESFVVNVQLLDVQTGRIEASARGKFPKVHEAHDVVPNVVAELVGAPGRPEERGIPALLEKQHALFPDLGVGFVLTTYEPGIELNLGALC